MPAYGVKHHNRSGVNSSVFGENRRDLQHGAWRRKWLAKMAIVAAWLAGNG